MQTQEQKDRANAKRRECRANDPEYCKVQSAQQAAKYKRHGYKYRAKQKEQYDADSSEILARNKKWRDNNPEKCRAQARKYAAANRKQRSARQLEWEHRDKAANPEKYKAKMRAYYLNNRAKYSFHVAKRRAALLQRTPPWANMEKIAFFYEYRPAGYEVDHVLPLQGDVVSGLHIAENLQLLPMEVNRAKSNRG